MYINVYQKDAFVNCFVHKCMGKCVILKTFNNKTGKLRYSKSLDASSMFFIIFTLKGQFASQLPQAMHSDALWALA